MTSFGLFSQSLLTSNRTWLAEDAGTEVMPAVPLDLTLFNAAQHYPNGYIPDGIVLGVVTATGKAGPYLSTAGDGRQTAVCIAFNPIQVYQPGTISGALITSVSVAGLRRGSVYIGNLPFTSGNAALGGYLDAAAQTALKAITFYTGDPTA